MTDPSGFSLSVAQNPYLAPEETGMDAVLTVEFAPSSGGESEVAEVVVIDRSTSMTGPKFEEAKRAAKAALGAIREDAYFALIAGGTSAVELYPGGGALAKGTERHKRTAAKAVDAMKIGSATSIGAWLRRAAEVVSTRPGAIGHVLLLTDGQVNQPHGEYEADLEFCRGRFACDAIGIGTGWNADELKRIADLFHGTREYCRDLPDLGRFFTAASQRAMGRSADEVELVVKGPAGFSLEGLWQVYRTESDLLPHGRASGARKTAFDLGSWGDEKREYLLAVRFPPSGVGTEQQIGLKLVRGGRDAAVSKVRALWTDDPAKSTAFHPSVVHYRTQLEGIEHIREGLRHWHRRDPGAATHHLLTALERAEAAGNEAQAESIRAFLDVDGQGNTTIRTGVTEADALWLNTRSDYTVRTPTSPEGGTG
ncbi:vWA domain-containing protein [Glycomyces tarimensis]